MERLEVTPNDDSHQPVDLWNLSPGTVIVTADGSRARVKQPTQDGAWILVEYLVSDDGEVGGDDLVSHDEVVAVERSRGSDVQER